MLKPNQKIPYIQRQRGSYNKTVGRSLNQDKKSNPIPARWAIHKLGNTYTTEILL